MNLNSEPNSTNIHICYQIRVAFIKYYELVIEIFEGKENLNIKNEIINYYNEDEFAIKLGQIINKFFNENKKLENIEKLEFLIKYNPYYIEERYYNKRNLDIFDILDLNDIDKWFIEYFRRMNFEKIFKINIEQYIKKLMSKVKTFADLDIIIKLINIDNISEKNKFLDILNNKYVTIIKSEIELLTDKKLTSNKILANIALINFMYEVKEKKLNFMKDKIKKLDKNIITLIFNEIIKLIYERVNKNEEFNEEEEEEIDDKNEEFNEEEEEIDDKNDINYNEMKEYIFNELINKIENMSDINNIITFLDKLEEIPKNEQKKYIKIKKEAIIKEFLNELIEKYLFNKDEFFSNNMDIKILLLYKLYEKGKIKKNDENYYDNIINLLDEIWKEIDGNIQIKKLEEFLKNDESIIKQRLSLLKILNDTLKPEEVYENLKRQNEEIKK